MSDYMEQRRKRKLNPVAKVVQAVTGKSVFEAKMPAAADVYGGEWPWDVVQFNPPVKIAITRAHYGPYVKDDSVIPLRAQSDAAGIACGYYGFLLPNNIQTQIDLYLHQIAKAGGLQKLPPICDIELLREKKPKKPPKDWEHNHPVGRQWASQVKAYLDGQQEGTGVQPMIYCSKETFATLCVNGTPPEWAEDYWFWVSWPPSWPYINLNKTLPRSMWPAGCKKVAMWQYWFFGRNCGFEPNDLNLITPEFMDHLGLQ